MAWNTTFPSLLAACGAATEVYERPILNADRDVIGHIPEVRSAHQQRNKAALLLAREFVERGAFHAIDTSGRGPWSNVHYHFAHRALADGPGCSGGMAIARLFGAYSPPGAPSYCGGIGRPPAAGVYEISVLQEAEALAVAMAATQAASAAIDAGLAAECAAALAMSRAEFLAELTARFPDRGFA